MTWLANMNRAMDYIEAHLKEETDYTKIAQAACCSVYHFQRMFTFMTDLTLSAYIRRRKMTLAASEIVCSDIKVIDVALKYGYDSPEAFTRAFRSLHGITPTEARKNGAMIKAFPPITFQLTIKGECAMDYKIVKKKAFRVYGIEKIVDAAEEEDLKEIPKFWLEQLRNGAYHKLAQSAGYPTVVNAACCYKKLSGTKYPYMLCIMETPLSDSSGYTVIDVPEASWVIFSNAPHVISETSQKLDELTARIYREWLPASDMTFEEGINFEMYYQNFKGEFYEERWFMLKA